jgi:4-hydroxy 2-oxovalerate aldolase
LKISILDCTLRDGGYVNDFRFGEESIRAITDKLDKANIDIIECGFLRSGKDDPDCSLYGRVEQIKLPDDRKNRLFVAMIEYGGVLANDIAERLPKYIDGIRLTFHNSEWENTKILAQNLASKGYKTFIQPVGTTTYTDAELLSLLKDVNELKPFAFYLVDTLGSMYKNDLLRMFYLINYNLNQEIAVGFHSHNNLQLSFANAMTLLEIHTSRHIIIDSSLFGMGRGAGNLNTELIAHFINSNIENRYNITPLLELIDDIILKIYYKSSWGFSIPYYLASIRGIHPNYAAYLINKDSTPIPQIDRILNKLPKENRHLYNEANIASLYFAEMCNAVDDSKTIETLRSLTKARSILVITSGNTVNIHADKLKEFIAQNDPFIVSVNFIPEDVEPDLVFISNKKRYLQLSPRNRLLVTTSNISPNTPNTFMVDYGSLIRPGKSDLAGIMVLRLLVRLGVTSLSLAGYDGFTNDNSHYVDSFNKKFSSKDVQHLNNDMIMQLKELNAQLKIEFITPTIYNRDER